MRRWLYSLGIGGYYYVKADRTIRWSLWRWMVSKVKGGRAG
jgi:hypothetical protein